MFYAFYRLHPVGKGLNLFGSSFDSDYLQTIIVVQMDVLGGDYQAAEVVLNIHEPVDQLSFVVVVNNGDRPGDLPAGLPLLLDQFLAYQIPKGLRAVAVALLFDKQVELPQQVHIQRDAKPY